MKEKVTRQCPQTTAFFEKREEPKRKNQVVHFSILSDRLTFVSVLFCSLIKGITFWVAGGFVLINSALLNLLCVWTLVNIKTNGHKTKRSQA